MKVLITGASSGIGRSMAYIFANKGYDLVLVARNKEKLLEVKKEINNVNVEIEVCDLVNADECIKLYSKFKNIDILVNNAGFGEFGEFINTSLDRELSMIDLNISALHILTKLFLSDFIKRDSGYILNVSSSAAFNPGPLMSCYYASKAYVLRLTESIYGELRQKKSKVYIGVLCPGPVDTNFNNVAGVQFAVKALTSSNVAKYAVKKMFSKKLIIIPGLTMKLCYIFNRFIPIKLLIKITYNIQKKKEVSYER